MHKVAIGYLRVSTIGQGRSGLGLSAQREAIERFADANGFTIGEWVEEVETGKGADALDRRPGLARRSSRRAGPRAPSSSRSSTASPGTWLSSPG